MLGEVFYWIFNMSIVASISILIVMLLRMIRRIPRRAVYLLWAIPLFRMVCPFGVNNPYGFMALFSKWRIRTVTVYFYEEVPEDSSLFSSYNVTGMGAAFRKVTLKEDIAVEVFRIAGVIWISVVAVLLLLTLLSYGLAMRENAHAVRLRENIYISEKVNAPVVYGICSPRIYLPMIYQEENLHYVLMHENMHILRRDNISRLFVLMIVAVHWFNPFAWWMFRKLVEDTEFACDESVLARLSEEERKEYALTLLTVSGKGNGSVFTGAKLKNRIEKIVSFRSLTWLSALGCIVFVIVLIVVMTTNTNLGG